MKYHLIFAFSVVLNIAFILGGFLGTYFYYSGGSVNPLVGNTFDRTVFVILLLACSIYSLKNGFYTDRILGNYFWMMVAGIILNFILSFIFLSMDWLNFPLLYKISIFILSPILGVYLSKRIKRATSSSAEKATA